METTIDSTTPSQKTDTSTLFSVLGAGRDYMNYADAKDAADKAKSYADGTYKVYTDTVDQGSGYLKDLSGKIGKEYSSVSPQDDERLTNRAAQIKASQIGSYDRAAAIASSQGLLKALKGGMGDSTQAVDGQVGVARQMGDLYSGLDEKAWAKAFEEGLALRKLTQADQQNSIQSDSTKYNALQNLYNTQLRSVTDANNVGQAASALANKDVAINTGKMFDTGANMLDKFLQTETGADLYKKLAAAGGGLVDKVFGTQNTSNPNLRSAINNGVSNGLSTSLSDALRTGGGSQLYFKPDGSVDYSLGTGLPSGQGLKVPPFNPENVLNEDGSVNYSLYGNVPSEPGLRLKSNTNPAFQYGGSVDYSLGGSGSSDPVNYDLQPGFQWDYSYTDPGQGSNFFDISAWQVPDQGLQFDTSSWEVPDQGFQFDTSSWQDQTPVYDEPTFSWDEWIVG